MAEYSLDDVKKMSKREYSLDDVQAMGLDPTEGMSTLDKLRAGFGRAIADTARGVGQMVGAVSRDDVAEARRLDKSLMNTGAGQVGNFAGNMAALLPTAFIPGANTIKGASIIGGLAGLAQPSVSTQETLTNAGIGGVAAPLAIGLTRGAGALYEGAKGLVEPLTAAGQNRIAAQVLRTSATNPANASAAAARAGELVPGSAPTLAQVADDPGLAQLERTLLNNPEMAGALQQRFAQQRAARLDALNTVAGNVGGYADDIAKGRSVFAKMDYDAALNAGIDPKMANAVQPMIESLMQRPSIQEAQRVAQRLAKEQGENLTEFGSVRGLDWLKKAIDNQISKAGQPGSSIGNAELSALKQTKADLMATLELISPAYAQANKNFAQMSKQVNSTEVAQGLLDTLQRPGSEYLGKSAKEMGTQYAGALSKATDSIKKQTGMDLPLSSVMPTQDISLLENIARDIGRKNFAENAGKAAGSNTAQNLVSQNMLRRALGPTGLPESWAESTMLQTLLSPIQGVGKLAGAERRINDALLEYLLDPQKAAPLLLTQPTGMQGLLGLNTQRMLTPYVAPAGLLGANAFRE